MIELSIKDLGGCFGIVETTIDQAGNILWSVIIKLCVTREFAETYVASRE